MAVALPKKRTFHFSLERMIALLLFMEKTEAARAQFQTDFLKLLLEIFRKNYLPY